MKSYKEIDQGKCLCPYYVIGQMYRIRIEQLKLKDKNSKDCPKCNGMDLECLLYEEFVKRKATELLKEKVFPQTPFPKVIF